MRAAILAVAVAVVAGCVEPVPPAARPAAAWDALPFEITTDPGTSYRAIVLDVASSAILEMVKSSAEPAVHVEALLRVEANETRSVSAGIGFSAQSEGGAALDPGQYVFVLVIDSPTPLTWTIRPAGSAPAGDVRARVVAAGTTASYAWYSTGPGYPARADHVEVKTTPTPAGARVEIGAGAATQRSMLHYESLYVAKQVELPTSWGVMAEEDGKRQELGGTTSGGVRARGLFLSSTDISHQAVVEGLTPAMRIQYFAMNVPWEDALLPTNVREGFWEPEVS